MRKGNKRGQAAMEFLMTYGWAILVVLVVIGALVYFMGPNIINSMIPDKCLTGDSGLVCQGAVITAGTGAASTIKIKIQNNYEETVAITNVSFAKPDGNVICSVANPACFTVGVANGNLSSGKSCDISATSCGVTAAGSKSKFVIITKSYKESAGAGFVSPVMGELVRTAA